MPLLSLFELFFNFYNTFISSESYLVIHRVVRSDIFSIGVALVVSRYVCFATEQFLLF